MKNQLLTFLLLCFLSSSLYGQLGFSIGYKHMGATNWESLIASYNVASSENKSALQEGTDFALDYWFRLKKKRIEFHPEVSYSRFIRNWSFEDKTNFTDLKSNFFNLSFHTNIYPLDFGGDCNCPTFSKDGRFFEKGLFIQLSPQMSYVNNSFKDPEGEVKSSDIAFGAGLGLGIDFGISDFITVTPMVRYSYLFGVEWEGLNERLSIDSPSSADNNVTNVSTIYVGFRLGFRFDELNKYGYR